MPTNRVLASHAQTHSPVAPSGRPAACTPAKTTSTKQGKAATFAPKSKCVFLASIATPVLLRTTPAVLRVTGVRLALFLGWMSVNSNAWRDITIVNKPTCASRALRLRVRLVPMLALATLLLIPSVSIAHLLSPPTPCGALIASTPATRCTTSTTTLTASPAPSPCVTPGCGRLSALLFRMRIVWRVELSRIVGGQRNALSSVWTIITWLMESVMLALRTSSVLLGAFLSTARASLMPGVSPAMHPKEALYAG